ncbi:MAG TPA: hypothetical protein VFI26_03560 [Lysobacter sp.]|nr:hypothetical protein [Lysobacter sp.]
MNTSFAHFHKFMHPRLLAPLALALACAGCASLPPPTAELDQARQALNRAEAGTPAAESGAAIAKARSELDAAQAAMAKGRDKDARALALAAAADADLAHAANQARDAAQAAGQRRADVASLRQTLGVDDGSTLAEPVPVPPLPAVDYVGDEAARLQALNADPRYQGVAAYERFRAQQALDALAAARAKQRPELQALAGKRVAIAEQAAVAEVLRRQAADLDRQRSELMVEASRQDAERARQEAERARLEAQMQAEEAERLRATADAEAQARQNAEAVVEGVGDAARAKLKAAREREAELARQEAELRKAAGEVPPEPKKKPKR